MRAWPLPLVLCFVLVELGACHDAPGCVAGCGGCTGKRAIRDFEYQGPPCLVASTNDCTDVLVELRNTCSAPAIFGNVQIAGDGHYEYRRPMRDDRGGYLLCPSTGECTGTVPSDETVVLDGTQNGQPVHIQFYVTGEQC